MKKALIFACIILGVCFLVNDISKDKLEIPDTAIRLRILANSNESEDQQIKEEVSKEVQREISKELITANSINDAENKLIESIPKIENIVKETLNQNKANYAYNVDYGYHHFPEKEYKGITYEEGEYKSLLVTLGKGEGNNWWCVLFPPLCLIEAEESTEEVEYKFFVKELIDKYF